MKTTVTLVLITLVAVSSTCFAQVPAQQAPVAYDPSYYEAVPQGMPQNGGALGVPPAAAYPANPADTLGPMAAAPMMPAQPPVAEETLLIDNGLWPGAQTMPGCSICGEGGSCLPAEWYLEEDVRILTRSRSGRKTLAYDYIPNSDPTVSDYVLALDTHSVTPDISTAWGMTLGHYFARDAHKRDHFVEFSFWGLNGWNDETTVTGYRTSTDVAGGLNRRAGSLLSSYAFIPNGDRMRGFNEADVQSIDWTSSTNNFEINGRFTSSERTQRRVYDPSGRWRMECQPGMKFNYLYGLRYFQLNEGFRYHSESRVAYFDGDDLVSDRHYTGDYDVSTHNNLLGLQIGAEMIYYQCRWTWGIRSKIGPFVNFADQESRIQSGIALNPDYIRDVAGSKNEASLVGEVGFLATYKFRPNLVGRASYDFMWVTGVATAPGQVDFVLEPVNAVNNNSLAFFHGLSLGLEWLW